MPWHPLPNRSEGEPEPLSTGLDRAVRHLGGPTAGSLGGIFGDWAAVVGDQVAGHSTPASMSDGTLVVAVTDPVWATELRFLEAELLGRIATALGPDQVRRIVVKVQDPPA